jgi:LacI family transcriptional regulator
MQAMAKTKLSMDKKYIVAGRFDIESGRHAMAELLALRSRPTAVFAANDPMGIGAVYACRDAGVAVPGDMSIVGAGDIEGMHHPNPFLTTIDWPRVDLGRRAATLLLAKIENPDQRKPDTEILTPVLLDRQSTAPYRAQHSSAGA